LAKIAAIKDARAALDDSLSSTFSPPHDMRALPMDTSDIRKGLKMTIDGQPWVVVDFQFVKPGKGQAFTRVKIKNLMTGSVLERTWRSGEKLEPADVEEREAAFSWDEGDQLVFVDDHSEQIYVNAEKVGEDRQWLADGLRVSIVFFNGLPIGVSLPAHVVLQIVRSDPGIKGDTASGATKPANVSTGASINVPLFVKEGEWVKIDTRTGEYLERVNK
jgi:elongation factor P